MTFPTLPIWAYLPDIRTFGLSGPGDDARHGQARLAGVDEVRRVHLSSQTLDVLQNGHLHLRRGRQTFRYTFSRCIHQHRPIKIIFQNHHSVLVYLEIGRLSLIDDEPHQDVELLVEWERIPEKQRKDTFEPFH